MKTAMIRARIEPGLKEDAESLFQKLGLSATQAITLFYSQVRLWRGLPFSVAIPNKTTLKAFADSESGHGLTWCKDAGDMFNKLGL